MSSHIRDESRGRRGGSVAHGSSPGLGSSRSHSRARQRSRSGTRLPKRISEPDMQWPRQQQQRCGSIGSSGGAIAGGGSGGGGGSNSSGRKLAPTMNMDELKGFIQVRTRFREPHPVDDYTDRFYLEQFRELAEGIQRWSADMTDGHDWDTYTIPGSVWQGRVITPEFITFVEMVATEDPLFKDDWENIIREADQRQALLQAMLWRALHIHVFSKLLFGANPQQEAMLDAADITFLGLEGFVRTEIRSKSVRGCLEGEILTENFWDEVDLISAQLTKLFTPILILNGVRLSGGLMQPQPSQRRTINWLHNIVAVAGYLSICIRYSPTIFEWDLPQPQDRFSVDFMEPYLKLKDRSTRRFDRSLKTATRSQGVDQRISDMFSTISVKIALAPGVARHKRGDGTDLGAYAGTRVVRIQQKSAVFYCACTNPKQLVKFIAEQNAQDQERARRAQERRERQRRKFWNLWGLLAPRVEDYRLSNSQVDGSNSPGSSSSSASTVAAGLKKHLPLSHTETLAATTTGADTHGRPLPHSRVPHETEESMDGYNDPAERRRSASSNGGSGGSIRRGRHGEQQPLIVRSASGSLRQRSHSDRELDRDHMSEDEAIKNLVRTPRTPLGGSPGSALSRPSTVLRGRSRKADVGVILVLLMLLMLAAFYTGYFKHTEAQLEHLIAMAKIPESYRILSIEDLKKLGVWDRVTSLEAARLYLAELTNYLHKKPLYFDIRTEPAHQGP